MPPPGSSANNQQPVVLPEHHVDLKGGSEAAHAQMLAICRHALPGWAALADADVQFSTVSGGISNINAKLTPARRGLEPVMLKVFGDKTEQLVDREAEKVVVVALGAQGFGPQVLALFANGRIEQWLHCVCLSPPDMCSPALVPRIARQLRRFHAINVALPKQPHTPWGVIRAWLKQARQLSFTDPVKQATYAAIDFAALEAEVDETEAVCALTHSPQVFGHNDLLSGNILVLQNPAGFDPAAPDMTGRVVFIDYEYGGYTFRDFDIANHFTEYAGFEGDYSRYPSKQQQELFFRHYMAEDARLAAAAAAAASAGKKRANGAAQPPLQAPLQQQQQSSSAGRGCCPWGRGGAVKQQQPHQQQQPQLHRLGSLEVGCSEEAEPPRLPAAELDRLSAAANVWALASHLYWGIWAVVQACYSPIDFDYLQFHATRLGEYRARKAAFLGEARRLFGHEAGQLFVESLVEAARELS